MLISKPKVKRETRVDKIRSIKRSGHLKSTELTGCGKPEHIGDTAQVSFPCVSQSRRATNRIAERQCETWEVTPSVLLVSVKNKHYFNKDGNSSHD